MIEEVDLNLTYRLFGIIGGNLDWVDVEISQHPLQAAFVFPSPPLDKLADHRHHVHEK